MKIIDISVEGMNRLDKFDKSVSLDEIFNDVINSLNVDHNKIKSVIRSRELVLARQIYCYVASLTGRYSLSKIATLIGNRHHSTVLVSIRKVKNNISVKDPLFMDSWDQYIENSKIWGKYKPKY